MGDVVRLKRLFARPDNSPNTASWVCIEYAKFKKMCPDLNDRQLIEMVIELRHSTLPIEPEKEEQLKQFIPHVKDLTGLAFTLLAVENGCGTTAAPVRDQEWVAKVVRAMHKVVETHGLHDIRLDCGGCPAVE